MFAFAATQERKRRCVYIRTSMSLFDYVVDHALVQAFPFLNDALSQLVHILDSLAVNPLLKKAPYLVIDRDEVWTI